MFHLCSGSLWGRAVCWHPVLPFGYIPRQSIVPLAFYGSAFTLYSQIYQTFSLNQPRGAEQDQ